MLKKRGITIRKWIGIMLIAAGIVVGLFTVLSPVYDGWVKQRVLDSYEQDVISVPDDTIDQELADARKYNELMFAASQAGATEELSSANVKPYDELLNLFGSDGMMGYLIIPKIGVRLPIYHGTSDSVLDGGVGHLQSTSLPVGGENTLSVLTGHRGLPTAKLFTRLDELEPGDLFYITIGKDEDTLAYEVSGSEVINPKDDEAVVRMQTIQEGKDIVELMTCHPYGINTERLFVIGNRVPYTPGEADTKTGLQALAPSWREVAFTAMPFILISFFMYRLAVSMYRRELF